MASEKTNEKKVIILNKPFLGGWLNEEGRIGHEIIDFFLTDNGKYYVYNNPWGVCPKDIWVGDSDENAYKLKKTEGEKYIAEYMVLTSGAHTPNEEEDDDEVDSSNKDKKHKTFNILYVIKLKAKLHRFNTGDDKNSNQGRGLKAGQGKLENIKPTKNYPKSVAAIIEENNIRYRNRLLTEIYGEDDSLYLTFEADKDFVYRVKDGEILSFMPEKYNFQRNKGYIKNDLHKNDYDKLLDIITNGIKDGTLEKLDLEPLNSKNGGIYHVEKTFLDLIGYTDKEQAFTNLLYTLLKNNEVFKKFCEKFEDIHFPEGETFTVEREKKVEKGRMDISGESKTQKVIIENKIDSGLNGLDEKAHTSQLSTYYDKWGKVDIKEGKEPLCFITAPDYRKAEIEAEIGKFDSSMQNIYKIVTYGEIAEFLEKQDKELFNDELISQLYGQIVNAFRKWSYKSREELYADLFLKATDSNNAQ